MAAHVYKLADGTRVPGVTTVISRFKESGGLIHWAWALGKEGKDYREVRDQAADAGTLAHRAVDAHIRGVEFHIESADVEVASRAERAFGAFLQWAEQTQLRVTETELSLISEKHRYGGTLDAILIQGKRAVGDWKSSNALYPEYLLQIAAYGMLLEECRGEPIEGGYHLLRFDKTYGDFTHKWWAELDTARQAFLHCRALYDMDKELKARIK